MDGGKVEWAADGCALLAEAREACERAAKRARKLSTSITQRIKVVPQYDTSRGEL